MLHANFHLFVFITHVFVTMFHVFSGGHSFECCRLLVCAYLRVHGRTSRYEYMVLANYLLQIRWHLSVLASSIKVLEDVARKRIARGLR